MPEENGRLRIAQAGYQTFKQKDHTEYQGFW